VEKIIVLFCFRFSAVNLVRARRTMTVDGSTFTALIDMGIEPFLARAAANRFHTVEPAVNWCFGEGMDVSRLQLHTLLPS